MYTEIGILVVVTLCVIGAVFTGTEVYTLYTGLDSGYEIVQLILMIIATIVLSAFSAVLSAVLYLLIRNR